MTLALDASTPAMAGGTNDPWVTASFTPPNDSLLVAIVTADWFNGTPTIGVASTGLTFVSRKKAGALNQGVVEIFTAEVGSNGGTARTVSATTDLASDSGGVKVFVVTGHNAGSPVDAVAGENLVATDPYNASMPVNSDGCMVFGGSSDWNGSGAITSSDVYEQYNEDGTINTITVRKATVVNAGTTTLNFNYAATPAGCWAGISIKPSGSGGGGIPSSTSDLWASGTPTTAQSNGSWSNPTNATGVNDALRAQWTSTGSGATGSIIPAEFGAQAAMGGSAPQSIESVDVTVYGYVTNTTRMASIAVQLADGGVVFGTAKTMTKSTSTTFSQTFNFTGVTWAQLANLGVRVLFTRGSVTTAANGLVDAVKIKVNYTAPPPNEQPLVFGAYPI